MKTSQPIRITGVRLPTAPPTSLPCPYCNGGEFCDYCVAGKIYVDPAYGEDTIICVDGKRVRLEDSLKIRNLSPTGFGWGHGGWGAYQLALGVLLALTGDPDEALRWYQEFTADVIFPLEQEEPFEVWVNFDQWKWGKRHNADVENGIRFVYGQKPQVAA